jgi:hypothetical protein
MFLLTLCSTSCGDILFPFYAVRWAENEDPGELIEHLGWKVEAPLRVATCLWRYFT